MSIITVITPTYNRADTLPALFDSLKRQTNFDFEWLIVDDGSIDDTKALVYSFGDVPFNIRYIKKENGGKHTALNVGIATIESKYTMIVDSDDLLLPNAIENILFFTNKYANDTSISGFSFLRAYSDGKPIVELDSDEFVESYLKYRIKDDRPGDMAEVFVTEIIKKYPFPIFEGERFLSEDVVWIEIGKKHKYVFINEPIYQCEYLEGGLTANDKPAKFASPLGSMLRGKQLMFRECGLKSNIKGAIIYNCYKIAADGKFDQRLKLSAYEKLLVALTKPFGLVFYKRWLPEGNK